MVPNVDQAMHLVRWVIATFGPVLVSYGYVNASDLDMATGVVISLIPAIWGMFTHTEASVIAKAAVIAADPNSSLKGVIVEPTLAGHELAATIVAANPDARIAQAGTDAATRLAK